MSQFDALTSAGPSPASAQASVMPSAVRSGVSTAHCFIAGRRRRRQSTRDRDKAHPSWPVGGRRTGHSPHTAQRARHAAACTRVSTATPLGEDHDDAQATETTEPLRPLHRSFQARPLGHRRDVIRGRTLDFAQKFLPDGLSLVDELPFLTPAERRFLSQVQGRTYANMFGLVERFISAKMLEVSRDHWLGDQVALEALVRFTDEELKHQELFRRIEALAARGMPPGYAVRGRAERRRRSRARQVDLGGARADLPHRAVHAGALPREHRARRRSCRSCGRTCSCSTGRRSRSTRSSTSSSGGARTRSSTRRRARRGGRRPDRAGRRASTASCRRRPRPTPTTSSPSRGRAFTDAEQRRRSRVPCSKAYRWQYIVSGVQDGRFLGVLTELVTPAQAERITGALAPLLA